MLAPIVQADATTLNSTLLPPTDFANTFVAAVGRGQGPQVARALAYLINGNMTYGGGCPAPRTPAENSKVGALPCPSLAPPFLVGCHLVFSSPFPMIQLAWLVLALRFFSITFPPALFVFGHRKWSRHWPGLVLSGILTVQNPKYAQRNGRIFHQVCQRACWFGVDTWVFAHAVACFCVCKFGEGVSMHFCVLLFTRRPEITCFPQKHGWRFVPASWLVASATHQPATYSLSKPTGFNLTQQGGWRR